MDIYALLRGLAVEFAAVERVPVITPLALWRGVGGEAYTRLCAVEEELVGVGIVCGEAVEQLEVCAAGVDVVRGHALTPWVAENVIGI